MFGRSVALANQRERCDSAITLVQYAIAAQIASLGIAHGRISRSQRAVAGPISTRTQSVVSSALHRRESGTSPRSSGRIRKTLPRNTESDSDDEEEENSVCCCVGPFETQEADRVVSAASSLSLVSICGEGTEEIEEDIEDTSDCCAYLTWPAISCNDTPYQDDEASDVLSS
jgi:hypothetical protein